jgi:hypothetical protein
MPIPLEVADAVRDFLGPAIVDEAVKAAEGRDAVEVECAVCNLPITAEQDASLVMVTFPSEKSGEAALVHRACRQSQIIETRTPKEGVSRLFRLLRAVESPPPPETVRGKIGALLSRRSKRWRRDPIGSTSPRGDRGAGKWQRL